MNDLIKRFEEVKSTIPDNVELVAVSKTKPLEMIKDLYDYGHLHFGENKVQELTDKQEILPKEIKWHMIGHVQGNKIKYMAPFVHLVHGIDKLKRLSELNKEAKKNNRVIDCLLQIHIAEEQTKFGFTKEEVWRLKEEGLDKNFDNVRIRGLMGMATNTSKQSVVRKEFRGLKDFRDEYIKSFAPKAFDILSMGMSGDYRIAIEEGSNMVRVGSSIFGNRNY